MMMSRGVERKGLGDLDHLLLSDGQASQARVAGNVQAEAVEIGPRGGVDFFAVDEAGAPARFAAEEDIGGDVEIVENVELLMDEGDAEAHRIVDVLDLDGFVGKDDFSGVGLVDAAEDFHQGRLASAVFAAQADDFGLADIEIDIIERDDARESFGDSAHRQEGRISHRPGAARSLGLIEKGF